MGRLLTISLLFFLGWFCQGALAIADPPKVSIYTTSPLEEGKENTVVCLVSGFHPPKITVEMLRNGEVITNLKAMDMTFESDWKYQWMKYYPFTYKAGDEFRCKVAHAESEPKYYKWDPML
ncbi:hypothetical protein NDU88_003955 [Pleurodeles waltl]|uniref:Beta-2-microglobulin n=1 Tax=Pleurodeles waltl TaxID=8319 RepID=A0AAV7PB20_PLEWA|nr:hypothetical protein NDU88_003955 [Pleurodeles waltl]